MFIFNKMVIFVYMRERNAFESPVVTLARSTSELDYLNRLNERYEAWKEWKLFSDISISVGPMSPMQPKYYLKKHLL